MRNLPSAYTIRRAVCAHADAVETDSTVTLGYDARFLRRRVLTAAEGFEFLVDLEHTTSLDAGDAFELDDGRLVAVIAAEEALYEIRGALTRLAWHIGNRHTPCQIEPDRLLIQRDHVMRDMLGKLGAEVVAVVEPFTPEGGAYGHGRTHGHGHGHGHEKNHDHNHDRARRAQALAPHRHDPDAH